MYLKIVLFVLYVAYTEAKKCPVVRPAKNFNLAAFGSGVWYDLARYPNGIETSKNCMSLRYAYDGNVVTISNPVPVEGPNFITATGRPQPDGSIYFKGSIGTSPKTEFEAPITIVKVKYDKFAIKYSCIENGDDIIEFAWVFSRSTNLNAAEREELNKFIKSSKLIDANRLFWLNFSDKQCKVK